MPPISSCVLHIDGEGLESYTRYGTADFPMACYEDDLAREPIAAHWHDELEVLTVVEGRAAFSVGDQRYTLGAGEGLFVNGGVVHAVRRACEGPARLHTLVFHPRLVAGGPESVFWQRYVGVVVDGEALRSVRLAPDDDCGATCLAAASDVVEAYVRAGYGYEFCVRDALSRIVCALSARCEGAAAPAFSGRAARTERRVKEMLAYVHAHYAEDIDIEMVARSASVSTSECLRCFHELLDMTPMEYVRRYRVRRAARLLETTDLKVADIGALCGFKEMSYFAKTFRKLRGCTPSAWRARFCEQWGAATPGR